MARKKQCDLCGQDMVNGECQACRVCIGPVTHPENAIRVAWLRRVIKKVVADGT
jgi:hypothetical protein